MLTNTKIFRVFISSTFQDMKVEREALRKDVFPFISEFCLQNSCKFQPIDLRWGIGEQAIINQEIMNICLNEIKRCQTISTGLNFITLLGDRYGWKPIPSKIEYNEFNILLNSLKKSKSEKKWIMLRDWYKLDLNAVPKEYCLVDQQNINNIHEWNDIENKLRSFLLYAIDLSFNKGDKRREKYELSATHQEITKGIFTIKNPEIHALAFFREYVNFPANDTEKINEELEREKKQVDDLKIHVKNIIPDNVYTYKLNWKNSKDDNYLKEFCDLLRERIIDAIKKEITDVSYTKLVDLNSHRQFALENAKDFFGRNDEIEKIQKYINGTQRHPLFIIGSPGIGKTALLCKTANVLGKSKDYIIIDKYIDASASINNTQRLIESLCKELNLIHGTKNDKIPSNDYERLDYFYQMIGKSSLKKIIILIDGMDQFREHSNGIELRWLNNRLPEHVKIIVSFVNIEGETEKYLRQSHLYFSIVNLHELNPDTGNYILDLWLKRCNRTITPNQREIVTEQFKENGNPLLLKLMFNKLNGLKSFSPLPEFSSNIRAMVKTLFRQLEADHGTIFVRRTIKYLISARNGLSEFEITNILSTDKNCISSINERFPESPDVSSLPIVIWVRFLIDVSPYLKEHFADDTHLFSFNQNYIKKIVEERYITEQNKIKTHAALAQYFYGLKYIKDVNNEHDINKRKVSELMWQCYHAREWTLLVDVLNDFQMLQSTYNFYPEDVHRYCNELKNNKKFDLFNMFDNKWKKEIAKGNHIWVIGNIFGQMGYADKAFEISKYMVNFFKKNKKNELEYAKAIVGYGQFFHANNQLVTAERYYSKAIKIFKKYNKKNSLTLAMNQLAGLFVQNNPNKALQILEEVQNISGFDESILANKANIHLRKDNVDEAIELFNEAIRLAENRGRIIAKSEYQIGLATSLIRKRKNVDALNILKDSEKIFRQFGLFGNLGSCLGTQANILSDLEKNDKAIEKINEAEKLLRRSGQGAWLVNCLYNQIILYNKIDDWTKLQNKINELMEISKTVKVPKEMLMNIKHMSVTKIAGVRPF